MSAPVSPWSLPRPAHLAAFLADARRRGLSFLDAWPGAMSVVCGHAHERDVWLTAFRDTRDVWQRAYEGSAPLSRAEAALRGLPLDLVDLDGAGIERRRCGHCGSAIPPERDPRARFCSDGHRAAAWRVSQQRTDADGGSPAVRSRLRDGVSSPRQLEAA